MAEFFDALNVVVLIIDFVMLFRLFWPNVVESKLVATIITSAVAFLLLVPYPLFAWIMFFALFLFGFFTNFKPWEW